MADRVPGSPLRTARVRAGWRLGALAIKVGLNENTLYRIEAGRTKKPKSKTRQKLAAVLKVKEAVLFGKTASR
jgi:ribosome-binding protein aMBF1 (putative translation factor)